MRGAVSIALAFKQVCAFCTEVIDGLGSFIAIIMWICMLTDSRMCCINFLSWVVKFTYSGVTLDPINATMVTSTIIVVLFSTLVCYFSYEFNVEVFGVLKKLF